MRANQVQIWSLDLQLVCPHTNFVQTFVQKFACVQIDWQKNSRKISRKT